MCECSVRSNDAEAADWPEVLVVERDQRQPEPQACRRDEAIRPAYAVCQRVGANEIDGGDHVGALDAAGLHRTQGGVESMEMTAVSRAREYFGAHRWMQDDRAMFQQGLQVF